MSGRRELNVWDVRFHGSNDLERDISIQLLPLCSVAQLDFVFFPILSPVTIPRAVKICM